MHPRQLAIYRRQRRDLNRALNDDRYGSKVVISVKLAEELKLLLDKATKVLIFVDKL